MASEVRVIDKRNTCIFCQIKKESELVIYQVSMCDDCARTILDNRDIFQQFMTGAVWSWLERMKAP